MYNVWGWKGGDLEVVVRGGEGKAFSAADRAVLQMVVITALTNFSYSVWVSSISYNCLFRDSEEYS